MKTDSDDMRGDYSELFANQIPVRGKYYERVMRSKRLVELDEDLLRIFPTKEAVNSALHGLVQASRHVHLDERV